MVDDNRDAKGPIRLDLPAGVHQLCSCGLGRHGWFCDGAYLGSGRLPHELRLDTGHHGDRLWLRTLPPASPLRRFPCSTIQAPLVVAVLWRSTLLASVAEGSQLLIGASAISGVVNGGAQREKRRA